MLGAQSRSFPTFGDIKINERSIPCIGGDRDILPAERESRHNATALDERMNAPREVRAQPTLQRSEVRILHLHGYVDPWRSRGF